MGLEPEKHDKTLGGGKLPRFFRGEPTEDLLEDLIKATKAPRKMEWAILIVAIVTLIATVVSIFLN